MSHSNTYFSYGTAGFRTNAKLLPNVVYQTAYYAGIRSKIIGKSLGLMITASHNLSQDNGVKVIDWNGGLLLKECELELELLVNNKKDFNSKELTFGCENQEIENENTVKIFVGTDTRSSAPELLKHAQRGLEEAKIDAVNNKNLENHTTPQLHFIVYAYNNPNFSNMHDYVNQFKDAYENFCKLLNDFDNLTNNENVFLDCANGVGSLWASKYIKRVTCINTDVLTYDKLNYNCGADYVKISKKIPVGFENILCENRCASLDGDADRLIYFYTIKSGDLILLDGDYIAALFAKFIVQQLKELDLSTFFSICVVQTAYSDSNSTRFFKKLGVNTIIAKTGVKNLEKVAKNFDIGIYFEANGHGTVCFSSKFHNHFDNLSVPDSSKKDISKAALLLYYFSKTVNEVVGDGIANLLATEMLLKFYSWSIQDWKNNTFDLLINIQRKVVVKNLNEFITDENSENILISPSNLQKQIDNVVIKYKNSRAFIRPSGTELVVRVFVEASTNEIAVSLINELELLLEPYK